MSSCTLNSTKSWLKNNKYLKEDGRSVIGGVKNMQKANGELRGLAVKKYGPLPQMMKSNDVVGATKNNTLKIYKPFFEWMDRKNKEGNYFNIAESGTSKVAENMIKNSQDVDALTKEFYPLLHKLGIRIDVVKSLEERFGLDAAGVADIVNKVIAIKEGSAGIETLTEEIAHFAIEALDQSNPLFKRALELVEGTEEYAKNKDEYMKIYKSEVKTKKEVLGKLLRNEMRRESKLQKKSPLARTLHRILDKFTSLFTSNELRTFVKTQARDILEGRTENFSKENLTSKENFFSLKDMQDSSRNEEVEDVSDEVKDFKKSDTLAGNKKALKNIIKNLSNKLIIDKKNRDKDATDNRQKKIDYLYKKLSENKTTEGIVEFTIVAETESQTALKKLTELKSNLDTLRREDPRKVATSLSSMDDYIGSYAPIIKELINDIMPMIAESTDPQTKKMLKQTLESLNNINNVIVSVEQTKNDIQVELVADMLMKYKGSNTITREELVAALKSSKDITQYEKMGNSLSYTSDKGLGMFDIMMKEILREAETNQQDAIIDLRVIASKAGISNFTELYEKDSEGRITNYIISKYKLAQVEKDRQDHNDKVNKKYFSETDEFKKAEEEERSLTRDEVDDLKLNFNDKQLKAYRKDSGKFFRENYKNHPEVDRIIAERVAKIKKETITEEDEASAEYAKQVARAERLIEAWKDRNVVQVGGQTFYKNELIVPVDKYINPAFEKVTNSPKYKEFYNKVLENKRRVDAHLPIDESRSLYLAPQIRKDGRERFTTNEDGVIGVVKGIGKDLADSVVRRKDEDEFGGDNVTDVRGNIHKFLPVHFTSKIENPHQNMTTDLLAGMSAYLGMAERHKVFTKNIAMINLTKDVYNARQITKGKKKVGRGLGEAMGLLKEEDAIETTGGKAAKHLNEYIDMLMFREIKLDQGSFNVAGLKIDNAKLADALNKYTAIKSLSLNIHSGVANVALGNLLILQERIAKEHFSKEGIKFAKRVYRKELASVMNDMGKVAPMSKMSLFSEYFDSMQDYESREGGEDANRSRFGRLCNTSALMFIQQAGEHQMQMKTALSIAYDTKVLVGGKEMNLWEAFDAIDGKLVPKGEITNLDGSKFDAASENKYVNKVHRLNQKLHGIYNLKDRSMMQRHALGRLATMFRKYLIPGINRRYGKAKFDHMLDQEVEGMYVSVYKFMGSLISDLRQGQFSFAANFDKLSDHQKANMRRTLVEVSTLVGLMITAAALASIGDDDDERSWGLNFLALSVNRLYTELGANVPYAMPKEMMKLLKSPAAGMSTMQSLVALGYDSVNWTGVVSDETEFVPTYKSGKNKGRSKFTVNLEKAVPIVKNIQNLIDPENLMKFYGK